MNSYQGVNSSIIADSLVIGESSWRSFVGDDVVSNYSTNNWIIRIDGVSGGALKALGSQLEADSRIGEVIDWKTEHESVERNGGLIFGTPGLLSLQFVVASIAAIASSFVFLSLVLNQRKKELAVLQPNRRKPNTDSSPSSLRDFIDHCSINAARFGIRYRTSILIQWFL